jgi:hypothetical protein
MTCIINMLTEILMTSSECMICSKDIVQQAPSRRGRFDVVRGEKHQGVIDLVAAGHLPNDGKVISDERGYCRRPVQVSSGLHQLSQRPAPAMI